MEKVSVHPGDVVNFHPGEKERYHESAAVLREHTGGERTVKQPEQGMMMLQLQVVSTGLGSPATSSSVGREARGIDAVRYVQSSTDYPT